MTPAERATVEAGQRVAALPAEVGDWLAAAQADAAGLGIHRSQLAALADLMDELAGRQRELLADRPAPTDTVAYAEAEIALTQELSGSYELWMVFRSILQSRRDDRLRPMLDAADLVAADAYLTCLRRARGWGIVREAEFREPPLVSLEATDGPATTPRGSEAAGLSSTIRRYRSRQLPIPVILFPADRITSLVSFCTIPHEVGHILDADLAFGAEAIDLAAEALRRKKVPTDRREAWLCWGDEVVADGLGVLLGGQGFASVLADWLFVLAPAARFRERTDDVHPPPYLRIRLLAGLLEAAGVAAWSGLVAELRAGVDAAGTPAWEDPYAADVAVVANALTDRPLAALAGHRLFELVPGPADDAALVARLVPYLTTGFDRDPAPAGPPPFPVRLVPVATELARRGAAAVGDADRIAERGLAYLEAIPRPQFLGAPAGRREYLRELARRLDVRPSSA